MAILKVENILAVALLFGCLLDDDELYKDYWLFLGVALMTNPVPWGLPRGTEYSRGINLMCVGMSCSQSEVKDFGTVVFRVSYKL